MKPKGKIKSAARAERIEAGSGEPEPRVGFCRPREVPLAYGDKKFKGLEGAAIWRAMRRDREQRVLDKLPRGASRFGGVPDLPPGVDWPTVTIKKVERKRPLLAQIDLSTLRGRCPALPKTGWLYAFGSFTDERSDPPFLVALHDGQRSSLVRPPLPNDPRAAGLEDTLPLALRAASDDDENNAGGGWIFGAPWPVFGTAGEMAAFEKRAGDDWINLLALASVGSMQWSDSGHLYLLIRRSDLAKLDFSEVIGAVGSS